MIAIQSRDTPSHGSSGENDAKPSGNKEAMIQLGKISNDERGQKTGMGCKIRAESDEDIV